jgi:hypothetical protein
MTFSSNMAATAAKLLKQFGQTVTITRYGLAIEDTTTGVVVPAQDIVTTEIGVLLDFQYRTFGEGIQPNQSINRLNKRLLLTTNTILKAGDTVTVDNTIYKIVIIKVVNPSGTRIVYDLWIQV